MAEAIAVGPFLGCRPNKPNAPIDDKVIPCELGGTGSDEDDFFFFEGGPTNGDEDSKATGSPQHDPPVTNKNSRSQGASTPPIGSLVGPSSSQCDNESPISDLLDEEDAFEDPRADLASIDDTRVVSDADNNNAMMMQVLLPQHLCPESVQVTMDSSNLHASLSLLSEDDDDKEDEDEKEEDDYDDVRSDVAVAPYGTEDLGDDDGEMDTASTSSSVAPVPSDKYENNDDDSSSSSSFTHDEWWDWLDNLTVAFIEIADDNWSDNNPDKTKKRSRQHGDRVKKTGPPPTVHHNDAPNAIINTSTEWTVPNTSYDGTEPETTTEEEPSFSWDVTTECREPPLQLLDNIIDQTSVGGSQCRGTWELIGPTSDVRSLAPSDEWINDDNDEGNRVPFEIVPWNQPITVQSPILRHCASVADFRSAREQQSRLHQINGKHTSLMKRSVSFKDLEASSASKPELPEVDCTLTQLRRISSNENLLLTLHNRNRSPSKPTLAPTEERIVSFDAERARRQRRLSSLCLRAGAILLVSYMISALKAPFFGAVTEPEMVDTCQPRVVSVDLDYISAMALKEATHAIDGTVEVASDVYHFVVDHLPNKPRVVSIDSDTYATTAYYYEDAKDLLRTAGSAVSDAYHAVCDQLEPLYLKDSLRSFSQTMLEANHAIFTKASDACMNSQLMYQASGLKDACDVVMDRLPELRKLLALGWTTEAYIARSLNLNFALQMIQNETSFLMDSLSTLVHYLVEGSLENRQEDSEFMTNKSTDMPYAVKVLSNFTPVAPHPANAQPKVSNHSSASTNVQKSQISPSHPTSSSMVAPVHFNVTAMIAFPMQLIASYRRAGESESSFSLPTEPATTLKAKKKVVLETRRRVKEILSRLDASGRLHELEAVLEEKFGKETTGIPSKSKLPLIGKYREEQLRELWLRNMEREIVSSTLGQNPHGKDDLWLSFMGKFKSLVDSFDKGVKRWNIDQIKMARELQSLPFPFPTVNSSLLQELWLLDIAKIFRKKVENRRARGIARFEWLNELWLIDDQDVLQGFGVSSIN